MAAMLIVAIGIAIGFVVMLAMHAYKTTGYNVPRGHHRDTGDGVWLRDMTDEERRAAGFVPMRELPKDWQRFMRKR